MLKSQLLLATFLTGMVAAAPMAAADDNAIEPIIVTTQKRAENVQDVAISMEVVNGKALDAFHNNDMKALTALVPNFYFQPSPGNDALYIRGFGSSGSNFGFEQSVSLYQDGIYAGRARQFMAPFFDVDHVEVLRGPQGALLGKNTAAGAVSITTAGPTDTLQGKISAAYNFDRQGVDTNAFISGPLTDKLSARLAFKYTNYDGYIDNTATGQKDPQLDNKLARLSLKYEPTKDVTINAKVEYSDFTTIGDNAIGLPAAAKLTDVSVKQNSNIYGVLDRDTQQSWNGSVRADIGLGDHTLTSVTGYSSYSSFRAVDAAHEANGIFHSEYYEDFDQFSQEVRLLSPTGQRFEYIVGAYYDTSDYTVFAPTFYNTPILAAAGRINVNFKQTQETESAFVAGTLHVTDKLRVRGSVRYTHNQKTGSFVEALAAGTTNAILGTPRAFSQPLSEDTVDPSVTVEADVAPDVMVYAGMGRGSKGGGYVAAVRTTVPSDFTFRGERSDNYEVGVKSGWLNGRLIANAALFYTKFKDLQLSQYNPALGTTITTNAAGAHSQGVEGTVQWLPIDDLKLSSSFSYLDTAYDNYPGASCIALEPTTCIAATNNLKGFPLLYTPKWSGNVKAQYTKAVSDNMQFGVTLLSTFRTKYFISTDYSPVYGIQQGWVKLDGRIEIGAADEKWNLALVGTNLTNEVTEPFAFAYPAFFTASGNRIVRYIDEPRTVSIEATLRF